MIRRSGIYMSMAALVLAVAPAVAQTDDLARVRSSLGEVYAARIEAAIDRGVRDGLPRTLLVEKALEGAAKNMPAEAVLEAVRQLAGELEAAAEVVGPGADPQTLEKGADALRHGIDADLLSKLSREHPDEFPMMVVALEDLLHAGLAPAVAEDLMRYAASQDLSGDEVLGLPATVRRLVREGSTPLQAASSVRDGLRTGGRVVPPMGDERFGSFPNRTGVRRRIPPLR